MIRVTIECWEVGFIAVRFNRFLRDKTQLGLADAKRRIDALLRGQSFEVFFENRSAAEAFVSEARSMFAICQIAPEKGERPDLDGKTEQV